MRLRVLALCLTAAAVAGLIGGGTAAAVPSPDIVISQVYGGGGNAGATYKNDFIELFNRGTTTVNVTGWSVQYAATAGVNWQKTDLSGTIAPGQYYLVREAAGTGGTTELPPPDASGNIPMAGGAGKVALMTTNGLIPAGTTCPTASARDIVGYGLSTTTCNETAPTATLTNTTSAHRNTPAQRGCQDTDNNAIDFFTASPDPRNTASPRNACFGDVAPFVVATTPLNGSTENSTTTNVTVTFSEPVFASAGAFAMNCTRSGDVALDVTPTGPSTTFVLDPQNDLQRNETCTVTVAASGVRDVDDVDPPDNMAGNHTFSFSTAGLALRIHDIQGAQHRSPYEGALVSQVPGVVTARSSNGFWFQDPEPDVDAKTSEGLFVFTVAPPAVTIGQAVRVNGRVMEFRPGGLTSANLTTTEITVPTVIPAGPGPTIPPTVVGQGGRTPPTEVIENDSSGDVETSNTFDVAEDGIDFYESLEGMFVRINNAVATGPRNGFGEISVLGDFGAHASVRTTRGGIVVRRIGDYTYQEGDFNPERMILDDVIKPTPVVHVRDGFTTPVDAVVDYGFGNFKFLVVNDLVRVDGGLQREFARPAKKHELVVATYNVENLDPTDAPSGRFERVAEQIVEHMKSPDLINVEEIQDNDGAGSSAPSDASLTWRLLIEAIEDAGGPTYDYRQIDPVPGMDGGEPGGNIRVGFLFRTDRGLRFVDRPGGTAVTPNEVVDTGRDAQLLYSPGRIDPNNPAFANSRKPLAGEFVYEGRTLFVIGNHLNSKGGDDPLFGRFQPPNRRTEVQRHQQAAILNEFVDRILAAQRDARVIVLGDLNDFQFSQTMDILKDGVLMNLYDTLPLSERYSYVFDGNSQALDHILVSDSIRRVELYDVVHMNSEFADQLSDHDPPLAYLHLTGRGGADAGRDG